ncbi:MAG: helix-turn-helix domain-containing protein [Actinomycetota bacterium]|nr:helix-turn-helix domain-containing protein [Actinomycetota bacterium]
MTPVDHIDPGLYWRDDMRAALARHDFSTVYRTLKDEVGLSTRRIATLTGQSQSEVCDILKGRQVMAYAVLVRICEGLGIPRELAHLSAYGPDGTYCGETVPELPPGVNAEMLRRHLLALGATAAFGAPIKGLGELLAQVDIPASKPMPSRLFGIHVVQVRDLTRSLREALLNHGSNPTMSSAATAWADSLLTLPGPEKLTRELMTAVAELHALAAGWAALDAGLYDRALHHYSRALELAIKTGDAYLQAIALACAGLTMLEHRHPNEGLKMLQFAQVKAWSIPPEHDRKMVESCALADSAIAYAWMGHTQAALTTVAKSRQLWSPTRSDPRGDQDYVSARLEISRGRLDVAEPFARTSVDRWEGVSELRRTHSAAVLATIHVKAGEPDGLHLAHGVITAVTRLSSVSARQRLLPLTEALDIRRGSDYQELARMARQVATTRV